MDQSNGSSTSYKLQEGGLVPSATAWWYFGYRRKNAMVTPADRSMTQATHEERTGMGARTVRDRGRTFFGNQSSKSNAVKRPFPTMIVSVSRKLILVVPRRPSLPGRNDYHTPPPGVTYRNCRCPVPQECTSKSKGGYRIPAIMHLF